MVVPRVVMCFSDTGGGHRSAVDAINAAMAEVIEEASPGRSIEILTNNVPERCHPASRKMVELYNFLLRHNQEAMKYYYWAIHATRPNESDFVYHLSEKYLLSFIGENIPGVLVSVHPMINQHLLRVLKKMGLREKTRFVVIVTDPNQEIWDGWACPEADLTIVPNDLAAMRLEQLGVPREKIRMFGMPIHPSFLKPPTVEPGEFRSCLGLDPDRLTVCVNSGWAGGGNLRAINNELAKVKRNIQAIFLCGHNKKLYERVMKEAAGSPVPTAVLAFNDSMPDLMSATDLMVTKAGGLTSFQCVARRLPMALDVLTKPMPQERGTIDLLVSTGLASPIKRPQDIREIIEKLPESNRSDNRLAKQLPQVHQLHRTHAAYDIARAILGFVDPIFQNNAGTDAVPSLDAPVVTPPLSHVIRLNGETPSPRLGFEGLA